MVGFHTKTFIKHDDYMTPKYAWENINHLIPKDLVIWEAFYGDGKSGDYLKELGYNVIHEPVDFFENNLGELIISNPPFSLSKSIFKRLMIIDKPFILLLPSAKINTSYLREWKDKNIQIIIPRKRIQFTKILNDEKIKENKCNFDCFYYCYKIGLEQDIVWLE